ncbi:hypothetical protein A0H76_2743 [Hepatospora eriocheir]|uniref:Uncharacterized protein n=1 Tax=Hepatospora eriocheir TaxID=1081669 RepID=A0A1X0QJH4_9MICR|nr:hypothetical protein HERIO_121 [Hepatospora eriocheir]ORD99893.1 hypothetical protein A0H76_2743 [Hepatospora eriocheir]
MYMLLTERFLYKWLLLFPSLSILGISVANLLESFTFCKISLLILSPSVLINKSSNLTENPLKNKYEFIILPKTVNKVSQIDIP